jgi:hypothetical protein
MLLQLTKELPEMVTLKISIGPSKYHVLVHVLPANTPLDDFHRTPSIEE